MELVIFFRYIAIILGLGIGFFSFGILRRSPVANKGWNYLAIGGISLSVWALIQTGTMFFITDEMLQSTIKAVSSMIIFLFIGYLQLFVFIFLSKSFEIKINKLYTIRNANILFFGLLTLLLIYNFIMPFNNVLYELAGISHLMMGLSFGIILYLSYKIAKVTKKWFWVGNFIFTLLVFFGVMLGVIHTTSCNDDANPFNQICSGMNEEYAPVIPFFFNQFLISFSGIYHIFIILGLISAVLSYGGIYKKLG
jgi:hypothetical protein